MLDTTPWSTRGSTYCYLSEPAAETDYDVPALSGAYIRLLKGRNAFGWGILGLLALPVLECIDLLDEVAAVQQ
jgi:hypothetical protein